MRIVANKIEIEPGPAPQCLETSILKLLAYFDIFQYPLTKSEIRKFLSPTGSEGDFEEVLQQMLLSKAIFLHHEFYSLHDNKLIAHRRKEGNLRAEKLLPRAFRIGRFLYCFPFVKAISISGSLSKNFADENADIDFFIITKANRLWLARTIMHLFKKLTFITGHQHYFCMNYYIDEEALLIENQNIYTALEIATLVPVTNQEMMHEFFAVNNWSARFFPACQYENVKHDKEEGPWFKRFVEWIFDNQTGDKIDDWLLNVTTSRWEKKSEKDKRNKNGLAMRLITGKHFSRSNPGAFQEKVLALYEQKINDLQVEGNVKKGFLEELNQL